MAYEHERWISNLIEYKLFTEGFDPKEETRAIDELKDVYAKAKAFNEILNIDLDQHEIIVHGQVEDIVNKYMEDK